MILLGHYDDGDVFDDSTTPTSQYSRDAETESPVDIAGDVDTGPSRYHHRQAPGTAAWNADAVCPACSTDDELRSTAADSGDDRQPWASVPVDLERRKSGFQRRRLGQLQLKHRLAVDLPEHSFPATHRTQPDEPDFTVNFAPEGHQQLVLSILWKSIDDSECQLLVVFVVALATLAAALNIPPAWLVLVVSGLSLMYFVVNDRRRFNSQ